MIEQLTEHVFRVKRTDLTHRPNEILEQIQEAVKTHHTYLISRSRDHATLNGSGKLIEGIDNDYRSHALIIVHKNRSYPVMFRGRRFDIQVDRYNNIYSILHYISSREVITNRKLREPILKAYMKSYGVKLMDGTRIIQ